MPGWVPRWLRGEEPVPDLGPQGRPPASGSAPGGGGKTGYFWKRSVLAGLERSAPRWEGPPAAPGPAAPEELPAGASAVDGLNRALAALALALYVAALFTTLQDPLEGALRAPPTSAVLAPVERQGAPKVDPFFVGALVGVALEEVVAARKLSDDAP